MSCSDIKPVIDIKCKQINKPYEEILYCLESGNCYDKLGQCIGRGMIEGDILHIIHNKFIHTKNQHVTK